MPSMKCTRETDGTIILRLSEEEAVVLHEKIAYSEFADDLDNIELSEPVEQKVFSDIQQALAPLIPDLGTDAYGARVERAYAAIGTMPY